jgi:hypothetical protein
MGVGKNLGSAPLIGDVLCMELKAVLADHWTQRGIPGELKWKGRQGSPAHRPAEFLFLSQH